MKIVSIANQKGGVGKSLITTLLAQALSQNYKKKILVIDSDPQQSITELRRLQKHKGIKEFSYPIESCDILNIDSILKQYSKMDIVFIDMPGQLYDLKGNLTNVMDFLWLVDYIFIPIQAGKTEIMSSMEYYSNLIKVKETKEKNKKHLDIKFFVNLYQNNNDYRGLDSLLEAGNYPVMENKIRKSVEYERSLSSEISLLKSSKTAIYNELTYFVDEFIKCVNL